MERFPVYPQGPGATARLPPPLYADASAAPPKRASVAKGRGTPARKSSKGGVASKAGKSAVDPKVSQAAALMRSCRGKKK